MLEQWQFPVADNDASSRQNTDFFFLIFFAEFNWCSRIITIIFFLIMISKLIRLIVDCSNYIMENWVVILEELIF